MSAFIKHYLLYRGLPKEFVTRLVVAACCHTLFGEINTASWNEEELDLVPVDDAEEEACLYAFEKADWAIDID